MLPHVPDRMPLKWKSRIAKIGQSKNSSFISADVLQQDGVRTFPELSLTLAHWLSTVFSHFIINS